MHIIALHDEERIDENVPCGIDHTIERLEDKIQLHSIRGEKEEWTRNQDKRILFRNFAKVANNTKSDCLFMFQEAKGGTIEASYSQKFDKELHALQAAVEQDAADEQEQKRKEERRKKKSDGLSPY